VSQSAHFWVKIGASSAFIDKLLETDCKRAESRMIYVPRSSD
jgi:hypothetical protein